MTDITNILRSNKNVNAFLFNPSIAWITGSRYLVSVRGWDQGLGYLDENPDFKNNPTHPWDKGWKDNKSDQCYLSIIDISIDEKNKTYQVKKIQDLDLILKGEDARVYRVNKNRFYFTYNVIVEDDESVKLKNQSCEDDRCVVVEFAEITIFKRFGRYNYNIKKLDAGLCWNLSEPFEKNWSMWTFKDHNYLLYKLVPLEIFDFPLNNITRGCFSTLSPQKNDFLTKLQKYYGGFITASLSTPSYEIKSLKPGRYLTLGHMKCRYQTYEYKRFEKKPLSKFVNDNIDYDYMHSAGLIYFSYWIEFEPTMNDGNIEIKITRISNAFLVEGHQPQSLNFASGLTYNSTMNILWMSYGEADGLSKIIPFTPKIVNGCLMDYDTLRPKDFKFGTLKYPFLNEECIITT